MPGNNQPLTASPYLPVFPHDSPLQLKPTSLETAHTQVFKAPAVRTIARTAWAPGGPEESIPHTDQSWKPKTIRGSLGASAQRIK